jgi:hypothetical protein
VQISERTGTSAALIEAVLDVLTALDLVRVAGDTLVCTPGMSVSPAAGAKSICADLDAAQPRQRIFPAPTVTARLLPGRPCTSR